MPTMISKRLGDLVAERESFQCHERRIVRERDEILKNVRNHLDQLDAEIVRLGGTARVVVGVAETIDRCRKASVGEKFASPKKRGRPKKETKEDQSSRQVLSEKENALSNDALSSSNDKDKASSFAKPKKKRRRSSIDKQKSFASKNDESDCQPWTCACGNQLAAGRRRCGKCKRWKDGRRETRWSRKSVDAIASATAASSSSDKYPRKTLTKAIDVYENLLVAHPKSDKDDARSEIESIAGWMVTAVSAAALGQMEAKAKDVDAKDDSAKNAAQSDSGNGTVLHKRKRGRPRKESIQRVVSTSDSDGGSASEAPRTRDRSREKAAVKEGGELKVEKGIA